MRAKTVGFIPKELQYWLFLNHDFRSGGSYGEPDQYWTPQPSHGGKSILQRAAEAGYTHIWTMADFRYRPNEDELTNLLELKARCHALGLKLVVTVCRVYGPHTTSDDAIFYEGAPVREAPAIVTDVDGQLTLVPEDDILTSLPGMRERLNFAAGENWWDGWNYMPFALPWASEWSDESNYSLHQSAAIGREVYYCIVPPDSPGTSPDADPSHWIHLGLTGRPVLMAKDTDIVHSTAIDNFSIRSGTPDIWVSGSTYIQGDVVRIGSAIYLDGVGGISNISPASDENRWYSLGSMPWHTMMNFSSYPAFDGGIQGVQPYGFYHLSWWMKFQNYTPSGNMQLYIYRRGTYPDGKHWLRYNATKNFGDPTGGTHNLDWTQFHLSFNTLDYDEDLSIYMVYPYAAGGTVWLDDFTVERAGVTNILRKSSAPVVVKQDVPPFTVYTEGSDYAGASDSNAFPNILENWHTSYPNPRMTVPNGSQLVESQRVLCTYHHLPYLYSGGYNACFSEEAFYDLAVEQINTIRDRIDPDGYFIWLDEVRLAGWDDTCSSRDLSLGEIVADWLRRRIEYIKVVDPGKIIATYNDMVDTFHNAGYGDVYPVNGNYLGSWEGLDSDVIILNWNLGIVWVDGYCRYAPVYSGYNKPPGDYELLAKRSLDFLAQKVNVQLHSGYYHSLSIFPPSDVLAPTIPTKREHGVNGAKGPYKINGAVYFVWQAGVQAPYYEDLEEFIALCKAELE